MKGLIGVVLGLLLLSACGGRGLSAEQMQQKLDSIKKIEIAERLEAEGIHLDNSDNPLKQFYDSLALLPLPITYSEDFVRFLPNFKPVPQDIAKALDLEGNGKQKAISLSESLGAKLMLLAADENEDASKYSIWLYSMDDDCMPVDKLCLFAVEDEEENIDFSEEEILQYFTITSDYEIHLMDYSKEAHKTRTEEVYTLDASRNFLLQRSEELNH
jgi:hypothetical protein